MREKVLLVLSIFLLISREEIFVDSIKIGAIFDKDNEANEKAFYTAIQALNDKTVMRNNHFQGIVKHVEYDNPYECMKATCDLLGENVVGILGPTSEDNSNVMQSILDSKEIPQIDIRWDDEPINGTIVNVNPYPDIMTRVYLDILDAWDWETFVILYENNESLKRVAELLKLYDSYGHRIIVRQLDKYKSGIYRTVLKELWRSGATHFVLDCSVEILEEVLRQAQQVGLMTNLHHYIITNLDLHTIELTPYQHSETNITGMRFIDPLDENIINVANDIFEPQNDGSEFMIGWKLQLNSALIYDAILMFGEALKDAPHSLPSNINCDNLANGWSNGQTVVNFMKGLVYQGLTGRIKFDTKGLRTDFGLDLIELKEGGITKVGTWNTSEGLKIARERPQSAAELDEFSLVNKTFRVITTITEPYGMLKESHKPLEGNDQYEGFGIDLIHELSVMEGFNYTFQLRADKKNGEYDENQEKWTGMIGDVMYGVVDLAITDLTITLERQDVVDFTTPFMNLGISILYQKPTKAPPSFFSFADPFAVDVWKLLASAYFGVSFALWIIARICPDEWINPYPCIEEPEYLENSLDLRNCFWFVTGSIMQQGSEIAPLAYSTRLVAGSWWFFTLIMVSSYTANLAAFLTTESPDNQFTNVAELVKYAEEKGIKYGAKKGGATANFFRDSKHNENYQKIWAYMQEHEAEVMVNDNKDGVKKAENEKYAFFMESTSIEYETQRRCELNQVGNLLDEKGYGIALKKDSPYRNTLSKAILKLQESGVLANLKRKWWEERRGGGQCAAEDEGSDAKPLDLKNVGGVFWVTIGGTVLACFLVFIELVLHVAKKSIKAKTPFRNELKEELKFYFKFSGMVKPVYNSEKSRKSEDTEEIAYNLVGKEDSESLKNKLQTDKFYKTQLSNKTY